MRNGNEILGLDVKITGTGQVIGQVRDLIVSRVRRSVVGLVLERATWMQRAKFVPCAAIQSLTTEAVMISDEQSVVTLEPTTQGVRIADHNEFLDTPLFSSNGHECGRIIDVCFNEHTGELDGFYVLTGTAPGATSGPVFLPLDDDILIKKDAVIVGDRAADRVMFEATEIGRLDLEKVRAATDDDANDLKSADPSLLQGSETSQVPVEGKIGKLLTGMAGLWHGFDQI